MAFFKALGFEHNPQFTGDGGACIILSDTVAVMLGTHEKFREFTPKAICDTSKAVEVLISLQCESREQVDDLVAKAIAAPFAVCSFTRLRLPTQIIGTADLLGILGLARG
jgi:hypothetical protein